MKNPHLFAARKSGKNRDEFSPVKEVNLHVAFHALARECQARSEFVKTFMAASRGAGKGKNLLLFTNKC